MIEETLPSVSDKIKLESVLNQIINLNIIYYEQDNN